MNNRETWVGSGILKFYLENTDSIFFELELEQYGTFGVAPRVGKQQREDPNRVGMLFIVFRDDW